MADLVCFKSNLISGNILRHYRYIKHIESIINPGKNQ